MKIVPQAVNTISKKFKKIQLKRQKISIIHLVLRKSENRTTSRKQHLQKI